MSAQVISPPEWQGALECRKAAGGPSPERVAAAVKRLREYVDFKRPSVLRVDAITLLEAVGNAGDVARPGAGQHSTQSKHDNT